MELLEPVVRQEVLAEQVFGRLVASRTTAASQPHHQQRVMVLMDLQCPRVTQSPVPPLLSLVLEETQTSWCTRIKDGNDSYNTLLFIKAFGKGRDSLFNMMTPM